MSQPSIDHCTRATFCPPPIHPTCFFFSISARWSVARLPVVPFSGKAAVDQVSRLPVLRQCFHMPNNHAGYCSITKKTSIWPSFGLSPEKTVTWKEKYARTCILTRSSVGEFPTNVSHITSLPEVWMGYCFSRFVVSTASDRVLCSRPRCGEGKPTFSPVDVISRAFYKQMGNYPSQMEFPKAHG